VRSVGPDIRRSVLRLEEDRAVFYRAAAFLGFGSLLMPAP
jgi:hypothetical protein